MKIFLIYLLNYSCFFHLNATATEEIITQVIKSCITIVTPVIAYFVYIYVYTHREEIMKKLGLDINKYKYPSFTDEAKEIIKHLHNTSSLLKEEKEKNDKTQEKNTSNWWHNIINFIMDIFYGIWNILIGIFNVFISIFMSIIKQVIIGIVVSIIVYYGFNYIINNYQEISPQLLGENIKTFFSKLWVKT